MKKTGYFAIVLLSLSLTGCISFTPAGSIAEPSSKASKSRAEAVVIEDIVISDDSINATLRNNLSSQFTSQLHSRIKRGEYFREVISFPLKPGDDDVLLKLELQTLKGTRTPHPAYVPGALVTLTMWIWVNGPIYVDKYNLVGSLSFVDQQGQVLANSQKTLQLNHNTGLWDHEYFNPAVNSLPLNQLVEQLLQDSLQQLPRSL